MPQTKEHILLARQVGVPSLVVFLNKCDMADPDFAGIGRNGSARIADQIRIPRDDIPIIRGSALMALEDKNPELGHDAILKLMEAVDNFIPQPARPKDRPVLMPIEDVFSISGRGTVVTGRCRTAASSKSARKLKLSV